ncbi:MAG TPA: PEP-CTERM sorting domain-containing protein [Candidatus Acidoferrales bacterium]|nr:PEP-CTERM sorting domain-containing protein [Candidatus Acidoferrales bacterium]
MRKLCVRYGCWMSFGISAAIVVVLVLASGAAPSAVVHAAPLPACTGSNIPCAIGNLEVLSFDTGTLFGGGGSGGGCGMGSTITILNDSNGDGFRLSGFGGNVTCVLTSITGGFTTGSASVTVQGINGFLIDDAFATFNCGVTTGSSAGLTFDPGLGPTSVISIPCPTLAVGSTALETGHVTFTPTGTLAETFTLSGTFLTGGNLSLQEFSLQASLVPAPTPEPGMLVMFGSGLVGLAAAIRRRRRAK